MSKKIYLLYGLIFLSVLFLSNISAVDVCWVASSAANCHSGWAGGGQVVMHFSDTTNAHGERISESNYADVLCCNFGRGSTTCNGNNLLLRTSTQTNSHAESPSLISPNYEVHVCYDSLQNGRRVDASVNCNTINNEVPVLYISSTINAHIESPGLAQQNYASKICAQVVNLTGDECGNGQIDTGETCDDGNTISGDGCSSTCQTEVQSHTECNNNMCEEVSGDGVSECGVIGGVCNKGNLTHSECIGQMCMSVNGIGTDECSNSAECINQPPAHAECNNNMCIKVSGDGVTECGVIGGACEVVPPVHSKCVLPACMLEDGAGTDECSTGAECIGPPPECTITSAVWSTESARAGDIVHLNVVTSGCTGKQISFVVREDDGVLGSNPVVKNPINVAVGSNGNAQGTWIAEYQDDESGDPEYYFTATIVGTSTHKKSTNELTVGVGLPISCEQLDINICSDYTKYGTDSETACNSDRCDVADYSIPLSAADCSEDGVNCFCAWNSDTGHCEAAFNKNGSKSYCGDSSVNRPNNAGNNEQCDPDEGVSVFLSTEETCVDLTQNLNMDSYTGGTLGCTGLCTFDINQCTSPPGTLISCGDNVVNQISETCDGNDKQDYTCESLGFSGGTLGCYSNCTLNTGLCEIPIDYYSECAGPACDAIRGTEENTCSGSSTCPSGNPYHIECNSNMCVKVAGDGITECLPIGDSCTNPPTTHSDCVGQTCMSVKGAGTDECSLNAECSDEDSAHTECNSNMCVEVAGDGENECAPLGDSCVPIIFSRCGDGYIDTPNSANRDEYCDPDAGTPNLPITQCANLADIFASGNLGCTATCEYDFNLCEYKPGVSPTCGDGIINNVAEECDGEFFSGGHTCKSLGFTEGTLSCDSFCKFDTSSCEVPPAGETGTCYYDEETTDTCDDDGYLTVNMIARWVGALDDPLAEKCKSNTEALQCPAQVALPFFGLYNLLATLVLIAAIYLIIETRRKKK
ncbi:MAG: hypothetical protein NTW17_03320 [Candidatus Pacearchaeota archaeon]|nr:hypothetical protein [Candidatus Pacearchaeota archaeon]